MICHKPRENGRLGGRKKKMKDTKGNKEGLIAVGQGDEG
jgi:hypothetical protein